LGFKQQWEFANPPQCPYWMCAEYDVMAWFRPFQSLELAFNST